MGFGLSDYIGLISSILLIIMPLPQLWQTYKLKSAKDISIWYILLQMLANGLFMVFGIIQNELYVIMPNGCLLGWNVILIIMKYYYLYKMNISVEPINNNNLNEIVILSNNIKV